MLTNLPAVAPGNSLQFRAMLQPVNAGPVAAFQVAWSVTGDPGASVVPNESDPTGLTATLVLAETVVRGATLKLSVVVSNPGGTAATATDTLTVEKTSAPGSPAYVDATGVALQQIASVENVDSVGGQLHEGDEQAEREHNAANLSQFPIGTERIHEQTDQADQGGD